MNIILSLQQLYSTLSIYSVTSHGLSGNFTLLLYVNCNFNVTVVTMTMLQTDRRKVDVIRDGLCFLRLNPSQNQNPMFFATILVLIGQEKLIVKHEKILFFLMLFQLRIIEWKLFRICTLK